MLSPGPHGTCLQGLRLPPRADIRKSWKSRASLSAYSRSCWTHAWLPYCEIPTRNANVFPVDVGGGVYPDGCVLGFARIVFEIRSLAIGCCVQVAPAHASRI